MCSFDSGMRDDERVEALEPYRITVLGDHAFIYGPNGQSVNMAMATMIEAPPNWRGNWIAEMPS